MTNLDPEGKYKYNQLKGIISPKVTCNVNAVCCAYECTKREWSSYVKNYHKEFPRIADKLVYFLRNEPTITELYKLLYPDWYNKWSNDKTKDKDLYSDNSIPPNEVLKILCLGFNLFCNNSQSSEITNYCYMKSCTTNEIIQLIKEKHSLVASFNLNGYGHIMTIMGEDNNSILVEDSYGMSYLKDHKTIVSAKVIPIEEFKKICKPTDNDKKLVIIF